MFKVTLKVLRFSHRSDDGYGGQREIYEPDQIDVLEAQSRAEADLIVQSWREMVLAASSLGARRKLIHTIEEAPDGNG